MAIQIGINGFGRIGRSVFRILSERDDLNVVCINDLFDNEQLAYRLKYDTGMGIFQKEVKATDDALYVGDQKVEMTAHRDPAAIPWKDLGVDVVIESTGVFRQRAGLEKHLEAGARKRVVVLVDDPVAKENVTRLARHLGCAQQCEPTPDGFRITIGKPDPQEGRHAD